jgi:hypothetical protein
MERRSYKNKKATKRKNLQFVALSADEGRESLYES